MKAIVSGRHTFSKVPYIKDQPLIPILPLSASERESLKFSKVPYILKSPLHSNFFSVNILGH
jgi:hypothetical protein